MKSLIKKFVPKPALRWYHWSLAKLGAVLFGHPSCRMVVIGVTGTKGKSTVANLAAKILEGAGQTVGLVSTIKYKIGPREWLNETKQTMPGRFRLQQLLSQMVRAGCRYAVVETSSEGIAQYRHLGIAYDVAVFTNLSPEHIESHGSYEKYRAAKLKLFSGLYRSCRKHIAGHDVKKIVIANSDDTEAERFLAPPADDKWVYGLKSMVTGIPHTLHATEVALRPDGISFDINGTTIAMRLLGEFNVSNALAAIAVGMSQGIALESMKRTLESASPLPGRMEEIENKRGIRIFVDYAHEPASLEAVYQTVRSFTPRKIIGVLGSQGGGRDRAKRPILGSIAGRYADSVIVTNEDPYDEDPQAIIGSVFAGAIEAGKTEGQDCWRILDRGEAIRRALALADRGDIVLITGKGGETKMAVGDGKLVPWDDKKVIVGLLNEARE
ncbi:MAG: UDP-N-acetylmuramoyl-L-alanyl-D-glutamate--2,6-diaminopimelate ligase [Patescibacteria group bacterium]|nr:UDP-N-acetylmuramoyl-L-alanyl-D-glutamate--2,6-diaminopimelate ligase [Patescibacteria group bacterium]MDD5715855.1 UDP-N-acetylmuramoyl-L-alanyl-D-glutamate--2,6-diaminopimelate ligase [Patescibacteria group bacterium]